MSLVISIEERLIKMYEEKIEPWKLGLPHGEWRTYQFEAYEDALESMPSNRFVITEAPVGIGKTAIAAALSDGVETTVLVQNLGLLDQYSDYGFNVLMGRQAYPCVLKSKVDEWKSKYGKVPTAADCHYIHNMRYCHMCNSCPYFIAREDAFASPRMACTYKYGAVSDRLQKRGGLLVMDEIHNAVRELLSIESYSMTTSERKKHGLPDFPLHDFGQNGEGDALDIKSRYEILAWIDKSMPSVAQIDLFDSMSPIGTEKRKVFDFLTGLQVMLNESDDLFYKCTRHEIYTKKSGAPVEEYIMEIKQLSPKKIFHRMTENKDNVFMMSATIGDPKSLICGEFGVNAYHYKSWPHPVPPDRRPVYDIAENAMTHTNLTNDFGLYKKQAVKIAKWINNMTDKDWRGIILTTSYAKVRQLKKYITTELRDGRHIFPSELNFTGLQERIERFMKNTDVGAIQIDTIQGWGTGVDLRGDIARYSVVAGVPLSNPADRFDSIRFNSPGGKEYAYAYAYNSVMQATGRVSRGETDDDGVYMLNTAALADKLATSPMAMSFYSDWFKDAIVKY